MALVVADIVISVATKVAEYLVEPAIHEVKYFLCVNNVFEDLKNEKEELTSESDSLQDRVQQAKERAEEIEKPVEIWLNDVKQLLEEASNLEQRMTTQNGCFQGRCPTWRRYRLCKQVAKKIEAIRKFKGKSNIQPFSHCAPLPSIQYEPTENFTYFESTKLAYNQLLEALQDDSLSMIGVYGMGGSGKTTLVTEMGKKAEALNLFEKVISITVSQTPNIKEIQGKMADMLSMKLEEESEDGRAQRLWMCLKEKKRVLIIVDDLWGEFRLSKIGILLDNDSEGRLKILVTTRRQEVCDSMDCQKKIHLGLLSKDESWTLFQRRANIDDSFSKSLNDVPRRLCDECKGLPIAIVTVGSSLKGKYKAEWEVALHTLKHSEANDDHVEGGVGATFNVLKLSYDYLKNKEAELLFLMCSLFPEDHEIKVEDLTRFAVGLGLGGRHSLESARSRIGAGINKLLDSCLLMQDEESKEYVKMHDLVRDVALWIAKRSKDHKIFVNLEKPLTMLAEDDNIRDVFAVSSWYKENQISLGWDAPNLEILLLQTDIHDSVGYLSQATFEGTEGLKVLSMKNNTGRWGAPLSLPQSTELLTNLQTLCLKSWDLGDISFIGCLIRLEVLDLQSCTFNLLPNEIGKLKRLKLLDLSDCFINEHYNGAIGKCTQLEELYFTWCRPKEFFIQSLVDIVTLPNLHCFDIDTGNNTYLIKGSRRVVELWDVDMLKIGASKKNILQTAEVVSLNSIHGAGKNIVPDMIGIVGGMNDLICLCLDNIAEIECIVDTTSYFDHTVPKLAQLNVSHMEYLTGLCRGPPQQVLNFFEKLEMLCIWDCPQLNGIFPSDCNLQNLKVLKIENLFGNRCTSGDEALFSMSTAQTLQQLEELIIKGCHELKQLIASERENGSNSMMPRLKEVIIYNCHNLKFLFPICCMEGLSRLEDIYIDDAPELEYVFGGCDQEDPSSNKYGNQAVLPHLEYLCLIDLHSLIGIYHENYYVKWPSLKKLKVENCPKLTSSWIAMMIGCEPRPDRMNESVVLSKDQQKNLPSILYRLELNLLPQLNLISWVGPTPTQILNLRSLQHLKVTYNENLKTLFSIVVHRSLPELLTLKIEECKELEQIISENEEPDQRLSNAEVLFPKLKKISVKGCNKLKSLFSVEMVRMLPQLSILEISRSVQLEEIFRHGSEDNTINGTEIVLPNLTKIDLGNLPNFVNICQGFKLQAVKLQHRWISGCPKIAPSLRAVPLP